MEDGNSGLFVGRPACQGGALLLLREGDFQDCERIVYNLIADLCLQLYSESRNFSRCTVCAMGPTPDLKPVDFPSPFHHER